MSPAIVGIALLLSMQVEPPERLSGLAIEKIDVTAAQGEDSGALLALSGLTIGKAYSAQDVRRAVKVLYQLDRFDNVYINATRTANSVALEIVLPPRKRVRELRIETVEEDEEGLSPEDSVVLHFAGKRPPPKRKLALSDTEVQEAIKLAPGTELDERELAAKRQYLEGLFRTFGYRSPAIGIATQRVDTLGAHDVLIRIDQGPRTRLGRVRYEGQLRRAEWAVSSFLGLNKGDYLDLKRLQAALDDLATDYRTHGWYEAKIGEPHVLETQGEDEGEPVADLLLPIDAGPHVDVSFFGHKGVSLAELRDAASVMEEANVGAGQAAIAEIEERIIARYERRGYWQARVNHKVRTSTDGATRQIVFAIVEGPSSYVASVNFTGTSSEASSPLLNEKRLREKVFELVEETLGETGAPGANPQTVSSMFGDHSTTPRPRDSVQPDTTTPDLKHVYVPRAYKAAASAIADLFRAEGYQTVKFSPDPKVVQRKLTNLVDISFDVHPGVRWQLGAMSFAGNEAITSTELLEISNLDPGRAGGEPLSFYNVDEASRAIVGHYKNAGYLYARVIEDLRQVPERGSLTASQFISTSTAGPLNLQRVCAEAEARGKRECDVELVFRVVEGPLVHARSVVIRGNETTRESLVRGELAVREGDILRESDMLSTRANLLRIGVFERVSVHPIDEKNESPEKDVICEVHERKHESFELGAGASTAEGVRAFATYGHQNLFGTALRLQVNAKINVQPFLAFYEESVRKSAEEFYATFNALQRIERELAVGVAYPQIFGLPRGFGAGLDVSYARNNDPAFAQDSGKVTLSGTYTGFRPELLNKARPITLQLRTVFDLSQLTCNPDLKADQDKKQCSEDQLQVKGLSTYWINGPVLRIDLRNDALDPRDGAYLDVSGAYAAGLDNNSPDFVDLEGRLSLYKSLPLDLAFAFSIFSARVLNLEESLAIPVNRKIFAGGSSTIRGYPEGSLFPRDFDVDPNKVTVSSGGLFVLAVKNELRFPLAGALSGALFWDFGDLYNDPSNWNWAFKTWRHGIGVGLRVATPVGPLTVDFAVPLVLRDQPGEKSGLNIHFSVRSF